MVATIAFVHPNNCPGVLHIVNGHTGKVPIESELCNRHTVGAKRGQGCLEGQMAYWVGAWVALLSHICPVINLFFTNHLIVNIGVLIVTISTMHPKELTSMF